MKVEENSSHTLVPTAGVKFEDQMKVVRAYVVLENDEQRLVHYKDVMKITRLARTQISGLNSFLVMLGLLTHESRGNYSPTDAARILCAQVGEAAFLEIRTTIADSPLARRVRAYFLVHGSNSREELIEFLLDEANSKEPARADTAVEWLVRSGFLAESDDGMLRLNQANRGKTKG